MRSGWSVFVGRLDWAYWMAETIDSLNNAAESERIRAERSINIKKPKQRSHVDRSSWKLKQSAIKLKTRYCKMLKFDTWYVFKMGLFHFLGLIIGVVIWRCHRKRAPHQLSPDKDLREHVVPYCEQAGNQIAFTLHLLLVFLRWFTDFSQHPIGAVACYWPI